MNSWADLVEHFSTPGNAVKLSEFLSFWDSLTYAEQNYYKLVDLQTGHIDVEAAKNEGIEVVV